MGSDGSRPGADRGGADGELPAVREDPERQAQEGGALREVSQDTGPYMLCGLNLSVP